MTICPALREITLILRRCGVQPSTPHSSVPPKAGFGNFNIRPFLSNLEKVTFSEPVNTIIPAMNGRVF